MGEHWSCICINIDTDKLNAIYESYMVANAVVDVLVVRSILECGPL